MIYKKEIKFLVRVKNEKKVCIKSRILFITIQLNKYRNKYIEIWNEKRNILKKYPLILYNE